jgi:hypothetical protein
MEPKVHNKAKESVVHCSKKRIVISALEEQSELQRRYWAGLSPEERFDVFYNLMHRFFDFKPHSWKGCKIIIDH